MDLDRLINAIYIKSLAMKRYMDKPSVGLTEFDQAVVASAEALLNALLELDTTIKSKSCGLAELTLGDLRELAKQLDIYPNNLSKEDTIFQLLSLRNKD